MTRSAPGNRLARPLAAAALLAVALGAAAAQPANPAGAGCAARSGATRATLVELYTSEGCSSCPPADRWLSGLSVPAVAPPIIPLGFHVDYWDGIGWKDRFASPAWSERQREVARKAGARSVYTPQVILDGRDYRSWFLPAAWRSSVQAASARPAGGFVALQTAQVASGLEVSVEAQVTGTRQRGANLVLAVTESRVSSVVRSGENRGKTLSHDHVVRALEALGRVGHAPVTRVRTIALPPEWKAADLAVAAWLEDAGSGEILQALRLAACAG